MTSTQYSQERWNLGDMFSAFDTAEIKQTVKEVKETLTQLETFRPQLSSKMDHDIFIAFLEQYDGLVRLLSRLLGYSQLRFSEDTQDQEAQANLASFRQLVAEAENSTLFFKLWWKGLDEKEAKRFVDVAGDFRYYLEALRLQKPYTLSEPEEKVINLKDVNGSSAFVTLYGAITNRYSFKVEIDGEVKELTRGELTMYVRSSDPDLRARAYQELYRVYENDAPILGQIYQYIIRDWRSENIDLRHYRTPIAVRNLSNDIPDDVVDSLLEVSRKNKGIFQRYFRLKARWLGVDKIRRYDVYAPVAKSDKTYTFNEAIKLVIEAYKQFDPKVARLVQKVLDEHHVDSEVRKGKRSGAFCATIEPKLTPWILASFNGRADDIATLAHELGHALHSLLANQHKALTQDSSLPLAETASTFGEMLLVDYLISKDPNAEVRRDLLFRQMDDNYATIMRQAYFAIFERDAHELIQQGASVDRLSQAYLENLQEQFGDSLDLSDDFKSEWVAIPHFFHTPFYVYAYAFGQLLVLSLYQQYRREGESFKQRYLKILAAGGSDSPTRILDRAGIEIRSADFWQGGFDMLKAALDDLEAIDVPE
jgi:oligoendopeptidase F